MISGAPVPAWENVKTPGFILDKKCVPAGLIIGDYTPYSHRQSLSRLNHRERAHRADRAEGRGRGNLQRLLLAPQHQRREHSDDYRKPRRGSGSQRPEHAPGHPAEIN